MTVRALAWVTLLTVVALSHGTPNIALSPPMPTKTSKSKWNPEPLAIFLSGLLMIRLPQETGDESKPGYILFSQNVPEKDSRCDLRLQEDEDENQKGWYAGCKHQPDGEGLVFSERVDQPASFGWVGDHQAFGNDQFLQRNITSFVQTFQSTFIKQTWKLALYYELTWV